MHDKRRSGLSPSIQTKAATLSQTLKIFGNDRVYLGAERSQPSYRGLPALRM